MFIHLQYESHVKVVVLIYDAFIFDFSMLITKINIKLQVIDFIEDLEVNPSFILA